MKKIYLILFVVSLFAVSVKAQVKIGGNATVAPEKGAVLELQSDNSGFLPSRVALTKLSEATPLPAHVEGMVVYNTASVPAENLQPGLYYNTGQQWVRLYTSPITESWFYMPSIAFDTATEGTFTKDLYAEFKKQLNDETNDNAVPSDNAPAKALASVPAATDLYYYVTAYDPDVFGDISITASGVMTYTVKAPATDETLLNIVFVEK
ncbi:MAG: hypothetical protein FWF53_06470 [Candidatus Azobacteroides sp.]|nr:hypothetical protein [Candidatus Azobacteroides sp.]